MESEIIREIRVLDLDQLNELKELAINGDELSQLKIGLYLIDSSQVQEPSTENALNGVNWLVKASRVGNEQATNSLRNCLEKNIGINNSNLEDVKWCLKTSKWEKKSRVGASKLFRKICLEDKNISKTDFIERASKLSNNRMEFKLLEKAVKYEISEEAFVNRILQQLQGKSGISFNSIFRNDVDAETFNQASLFTKIINYPKRTISWIVDTIVETAGNQGMMWLKTIMPVHQIYMLVVLFVYSLISIRSLLWLIPLFGFYLCYSSTVIFTLQMFYSRRKLNDVRALAGMLERISDTFILENAESAYSWSSLTPYISFFVSMFFTVMTFSIADKAWIPCSEIACLSIVITMACWFALNDKYDHLALYSILLDNLSNLSYLTKVLPDLPVLTNSLNFLLTSQMRFETVPGLYFTISMPSIAFLAVPVIFFYMAIKKSWKGTYQILVPHLVCFLWWRAVFLFLSSSSLYGLARASLGWAALTILTPFLLVIGVVWLMFAFIQIFSLTSLLKIFTTISLLSGVAIFAYWSRAGFRMGKFSLDSNSMSSNLLLIIALLVSSLPLAYISSPNELGKIGVYLPWQIYQSSCGNKLDEKNTLLKTQMLCNHFIGTKVNWTGTIKQVTIKQIENHAENVVALLPSFMSDWLRCTYGEYYPENCTELSSHENQDINIDQDYLERNKNFEEYIKRLEHDTCLFNKIQGRFCHLKQLNRYTFEIAVMISEELNSIDNANLDSQTTSYVLDNYKSLSNDIIIKLIAPDYFHNILIKLKLDDIITFRGFLSDNIVSTILLPTVKIYNLKCLTCEENGEGLGLGLTIQLQSWGLLESFRQGLFSVWNFFFGPLLIFQ